MDRLLRLIALLAILPFVMPQDTNKGVCECAVFPVQSSESIIEHKLQYNVTCDQEGEEKCQHLCIALAESAREKAPEMICEKLNHSDYLEVAVYAKACNLTAWKFTGLKSSDPICCHAGGPIICTVTTSSLEDQAALFSST